MHALLLIGHGSLRLGSGAAMIRLAARLRERGAADLSGAAFLNYSRPDIASAVARLVRNGATSLHVLPYFLVSGYFTSVALPQHIAVAQTLYPQLSISQAAPLGYHPLLAAVLHERLAAAGADHHSAALLVAHGSPDHQANAPILALAADLRADRRYGSVAVAYLSLNQPSIPAAVATLVAAGQRHIVMLPYLLQFGGHVAADLPIALAAARAAHPQVQIDLAAHLGYHPLLAAVLHERAAP